MNTFFARRHFAVLGRALAAALTFALLLAGVTSAQDYTTDFNRDGCTFTSTGFNPYFPLLPGYVLVIEGEEEDEGEVVVVSATISVLDETEVVDGVVTRVVVERELEDDELVEISRNFFAVCRETGDVWYFGEDVDIYEDGEIVNHEGAWRAGIDGAQPGIQMPGTPMLGARFFEEVAPGVALDRAEILSMDETVEVPAGTFQNVLRTFGDSELIAGPGDDKYYAKGVGIVKDDVLELVSITAPPCMPDATTHCLNDGRFRVTAEWETGSGEGDANAILSSSDSGEFWFFNSNNTELLVKVLDGCATQFNSYWVFAAGLTNIEVHMTVTDTVTGFSRVYDNLPRTPFQPVQDTGSFRVCP